MTSNRLILLISLWIVATANHSFWSLLFSVNGVGTHTWLFAASLFVAITALIMWVLRVLSPGRSVRAILSVLLLITAITSWLMDTYGVSIDAEMLRNAVQTNPAEARDFIGWSLLWRILWQAWLPMLLVWRVRLPATTWWQSIRQYTMGALLSPVVLLAAALPLYVSYASFFRNQQTAEQLIVPANLVRASVKLVIDTLDANAPFVTVGTDARHTSVPLKKPLLTLLVVGETARAANFSLGGYSRPTNLLLAKRDVLYFSNVRSCGTATAMSVPCMFSDLPHSEFNLNAAEHRDTVLDILQRAGLAVTWVDNQSGCKGVCARIPTEHAVPDDSHLCSHNECLDEALLYAIDRKSPTIKVDTMMVMHPMGSHGPSYYRRVPPAYEVFKPTCATERIETCSIEQIVNAYDNTIAYTDYVLAGMIDRLQRYQDQFDSVLIYISDHGESLGENGLYLHGEPYAIAPDVQKQVPMLLWFSTGAPARLGVDLACLRGKLDQPLSHDYLSHTLLGLNSVSTSVYRPQLDLLNGCRSN
ncbi:MAG: phosphoethanolamine transferase [Steroidobacteraceae bacterium]